MCNGGDIPGDAVTALFHQNGHLSNFRVSISREICRGHLIEDISPGDLVVENMDEARLECALFARAQGLDEFYITDETTNPDLITRVRID